MRCPGFSHCLLLVCWCVFMSLPMTMHADVCSDGNSEQCTIRVSVHKSTVWDAPRSQSDGDFKKRIKKIHISNPKIANIDAITESQVLIQGIEVGRTNLIIWYEKEEVADVFEVEVFFDGSFVAVIERALNKIVPTAKVEFYQEENGAGLTLYGSVESQTELDTVLKVVSNYAESYTNLINIQGSQQVQLEVKIAEVSRSGAKQMGLGFLVNQNWTIGLLPSGSGASGTIANTTGSVLRRTPTEISTYYGEDSTGYTFSETQITQGSESLTSGITKSLNSQVDLTSPFASAFQLVVESMDDDFMGILSILKNQSLARVMASPTLVTMNGQEASFLAGGEYPIPVSTGDGAVSIDYKKYGIMLNFTPYVIGKETITLKVDPEISSLDYSNAVASGGAVVPGLTTRRGSTTLQLKDGQTFVMAGLLREELSTITDKVPLLGDIPYIGTLFTSKELQKSESELMIIVTPRLVRALNPEEVPTLPGEGEMGMVSDWDFFVQNRVDPSLERNQLEEEPELIGGSGFAK